MIFITNESKDVIKEHQSVDFFPLFPKYFEHKGTFFAYKLKYKGIIWIIFSLLIKIQQEILISLL